MKEEDFKTLIVLGVIGMMWLSAVIVILVIKANRFLFWIDVFLLIVSIPIVIFLLYLLFTKENSFEFEGWTEVILIAFVILLFLFAIFNIDNHYEKGYGDAALKTLIQKTQEKEDLELVFNTLVSKGENLQKISIDRAINALCADSLIQCNQKREYSDKLVDLRGYKDSADFIAKLLWIR